MADATFFNDLSGDSANAKPRRPLYAIDLDATNNEKEILEWLQGDLGFIADSDDMRLREIQRNLALYKGFQYRDEETRRDTRTRDTDKNRKLKKIVINHLFDLTQSRIAKLIKFKPAVGILPTNDEFKDVNSAKVTKQLLDHIWYINDFEGVITNEIARDKSVTGEGYLFITWDPDAGDLHPDSDPNKKIPLLDESGDQMKDDSENPIWIEQEVRVGDVCYEVTLTMEVFLQRGKKRWKDVEYLYKREVMPVDEARVRWPKKSNKIKADEDQNVFDFESLQLEPVTNQTIIHHFYHRPSKAMPKGRYIVFAKDVLLHNEEYPYEHGKLPCVRLTDLDFPGEVHGQSFFRNVKAITNTYNNLTNLILRNQIMVSHPKWIVPAGSTKVEQLGNDITIAQFKGPIPPKLVQANPTPNELFTFREQLKEEFQQMAQITGVSRGEPPAGIKAGIALQFLAEQENERFNESVLKYNEFVRQVAIMTLAVAGDYYEADDERMMRVLGADQEWRSQFFDVANLAKDYDIRIQNTSALPRSVAARTQTLLDLQERFPDRFTSDQVLDMLDLAQNDKFVDAATINVRHAEAENEEIIESAKTKEPEPFEDHIAHWKIHTREMQEYKFKNMAPQKNREAMVDHVRTHEMFMAKQGAKNPVYGEKLMILDNFPIFFKRPQPLVNPLPAPDQQQPNRKVRGSPQPTGQERINPSLGGQPQQQVNPQAPPSGAEAARDRGMT